MTIVENTRFAFKIQTLQPIQTTINIYTLYKNNSCYSLLDFISSIVLL